MALLSRRPPLIEFYSRNVSVGSLFNRCATAINHRFAEEKPAGLKWPRRGDGFERVIFKRSTPHDMFKHSDKGLEGEEKFIMTNLSGFLPQSQ